MPHMAAAGVVIDGAGRWSRSRWVRWGGASPA